MKKGFLIILAIILIPVLLFAIFGLPVSVPSGFVVPTENIKCGESMAITIFKKGLPDAMDTSSFGETGAISFSYYNEEIMGMNMTCRYSYRFNDLCRISYFADYDEYDNDEFIKTVDKYMTENLDDNFKKTEEDESGNNCEYSYHKGAVSETVSVSTYKGEGIVRIEFMF